MIVRKFMSCSVLRFCLIDGLVGNGLMCSW